MYPTNREKREKRYAIALDMMVKYYYDVNGGKLRNTHQIPG